MQKIIEAIQSASLALDKGRLSNIKKDVDGMRVTTQTFLIEAKKRLDVAKLLNESALTEVDIESKEDAVSKLQNKLADIDKVLNLISNLFKAL